MTAPHSTPESVTTQAHWFGEPGQPIISWLSETEKSNGKSGVIVLPPIGYEYWTTHRALRDLAEQLARSGHSVLRIDYRGTGDSSGDKWDAGILSQWKRDIQLSALELRKTGVTSIALVGLRIGALLALNLAQEVDANAVVAWIPVTAGRRYVKELQLLSSQAPEDSLTVGGSGTRFLAGCVFTSELLAELSALSVDAVQTTARALILDRPDKPSSKDFMEKLKGSGALLEQQAIEGADQMLDVPTEYATTPTAHLNAIVDWLRPQATECGTGLLQSGKFNQDSGHFSHDGAMLTEREVRLGKDQLVGIECNPASQTPRATVVFLNTGSEPHIGPGRAWVELGRQLAAIGYRTIRVDFQGWGESPDNGFAPGRPYDSHAVDDAHQIAKALTERGDNKIIFVGLCASAWVSLRDCQNLLIDGLIAFNPQLYWQTGDPVWATMPESIAWCWQDDQKVWTDPSRKAAVQQWLEKIQASRFPIDFWFEKDDMGIRYLREQLGMTIAGKTSFNSLTINELEKLDHAMHRQWHRSEALNAIRSLLERTGN
ncbi:alpha/beta fold hydrolase [Aquabacterium sp. NJ1]|uniref:alpha/beta fold hydrolase n=1 Tax=Aquabacterium sp. NJ1 TaxID=1538295 RepID=UPI00126A4137|nr:alpha/beta fold hydrolase [Aquabacterium sp. NJ1]